MRIAFIDQEGRQQVLSASSIRVYSDAGHLFMAASETGPNTLFFGHLLDDDWEKLLKVLGLDRVEVPPVKFIKLDKP